MKKLFLIFLICIPSICLSQAGVARQIMISENAMNLMSADWNDTLTTQHERGYCVSSYEISYEDKSPSLILIKSVVRAPTSNSTPYSISFDCGRMPVIHTHPPTTCKSESDSSCKLGGKDAYQCDPSKIDVYYFLMSGIPFGLIQCDKHAFRSYFAEDYMIHP